MKQKEIFSTGMIIGIAVVGIWCALTAIRNHDNTVLGSGAFKNAPRLQISEPVRITDDERRISAMFAADTLPGLKRSGLVRKFERTDAGTIVMVSGIIWKPRSEFFKHSFLKAIRVFNTVNRYDRRTQVMDAATGTLYAEILPSSEMKFYD